MVEKNYLEALIPSGKGLKESIITTSVDASLDDRATEPEVCEVGSGVAGASAGFGFAFVAFDLSLGPWLLGNKFLHLSCQRKTNCNHKRVTFYLLQPRYLILYPIY